jgi:hypothetical protein
VSVGWLGRIVEAFEKYGLKDGGRALLRRLRGSFCIGLGELTVRCLSALRWMRESPLFIYSFGLGCIVWGKECESLLDLELFIN